MQTKNISYKLMKKILNTYANIIRALFNQDWWVVIEADSIW